MRALAIILLAIFSMSFSTESKQPANACSLLSETTYTTGETFTLKVWYNWKKLWMSAGECTFKIQDDVIQGRPVYHVSAIGSTYKSYDWFYKVRDRYETYIDKETKMPLKYKRDIQEGEFKFKYEYDWDRASKTVKSKHTSNKGKVTNSVVKYNAECAQDILSAIFFTRCMDFSGMKPGETIPMPLVLDGKYYENLYVRYLGKEKLKTDFGTFNTIKFAPLLIDGTIFSGGEKMVVWATDDANRVPIKVVSPITVGEVKVFLTSATGLKHPMTAKVKS